MPELRGIYIKKNILILNQVLFLLIYGANQLPTGSSFFMEIAQFFLIFFFISGKARKKPPRGWLFARQYLHIFILTLTAKSNSCVMFISWSLRQLPGKILNWGLMRFLCLFWFIYLFVCFFLQSRYTALKKIDESALAVFAGTHFVYTSSLLRKRFLCKAF